MEDARAAEAAAAEAREVEELLQAEQARVERESIEVRYDLDERTRHHMQAYEARRYGPLSKAAASASGTPAADAGVFRSSGRGDGVSGGSAGGEPD